MKVAGKLTPTMKARALELRDLGMSLREASAKLTAEGIPLSHVAVRNVWQASPAARPSRGGRGRGGSERGKGTGERAGEDQGGGADGAPEGDGGEGKGARPVAPSRVEGIEQIHALLKEPVPELPDDAPVPAKMVWQEIRALRAVSYAQLPLVASGDYSVSQFASAANQLRQLRKELRESLPPPKPDPAKDPTNVAARIAVHAHILQAVEAVESRLWGRNG